MMDANIETAVRELMVLQRQYAEYTSQPEFRFEEYCNPQPGSFMEHYRRRALELARELGALPLTDFVSEGPD
jgi:hypothetical protein